MTDQLPTIDCGTFDTPSPSAAPKKPNRGGRPKLTPPADAAATRALIASEVIRHKPRELMLRGLFRLLNEYKQHEKSPLEMKRLELEEESARQKREALELQKQELLVKKAEYRRRLVLMPHGHKQLIRSLELLEAEVTELKKTIAVLMAELEARAA